MRAGLCWLLLALFLVTSPITRAQNDEDDMGDDDLTEEDDYVTIEEEPVREPLIIAFHELFTSHPVTLST